MKTVLKMLAICMMAGGLGVQSVYAEPLVIQEQGSFSAGGTIITAPGTFDAKKPLDSAGQTYHGDHASVFYQIPENPHKYPIVMLFDYNNDDEHRIVMLQGDRRHAGTPEDSVISREQIAQVLVTALSNDAAKNKTFELVAERGEAQQDLTLLFAELRNDNPQKNDGVFDIDNMPLTEEPECVINDLNLYSKNSKI